MEQETQDTGWKTKVLIIGGVVGALLGVGTTYLLVQQSDRKGETLKIGTGEGLRLGMVVLGMLRQVSRLGDKED